MLFAYRPPTFFANHLRDKEWPLFLQQAFLLREYSSIRLWVYLTTVILMILFCLGIRNFILRKRLQRGLDALRLGTEDNRPRILTVSSGADKKTKIKIHSLGVGFEKYQSRRGDLEAAFGQTIESISPQEGNPKIINIAMSKIPLPKLVSFSENASLLNKDGAFLIGQSRQGFIAQNIAELPHLLIAGTTGSGKSVFFKQALVGLMESSPTAKFYLMDFKRGVEFGGFSAVPGVRVVKDKAMALSVLQEAKAEMRSRFDYLERHKLTKIEPEIHKIPRFYIAIDEASELLALPDRLDPDRQSILESRQIVNEIAKLGRAAAIHLLIATQKVSKTIIDTALQENIGGRMAFRMATLVNSAQVLGGKDATDLPEIPGRAYWCFGTKLIEVQVPFLDDEELNGRIQRVSNVRAKATANKSKEDDAKIKLEGERPRLDQKSEGWTPR